MIRVRKYLKEKIFNPVVVFIAASLVLFSPLLLTGQAFYWGTPSLQFIPWWDFAFETLLNGEIPLWNPWVGMGAPLIANYQSALFYPPYWILLLVYAFLGIKGMAWFITLIASFHITWASLGTGKLLNDLKIGKLGQVVGGLAFGLSGYLVARAGFLSINAAVAWLPWILLYSYRLAAGKKRTLIKLAIIIALQLLAGHAQTAWYSILLASIWVIFWAWRNRQSENGNQYLVLICGKFALSGLLAVGLSAIQLIPTLEYLLQSQRAGEYGYAQAMTYSFWPWRFTGFLVPHLFGTPMNGDYWGYGNFWEDAIYIGLIPIFLALSAIFRSLRQLRSQDPLRDTEHKNAIRFLGLIVLVSFALALGDNTPLFPFLYRHVPSFDLFQAPTRFSILAVMSLALLAGIGTDCIERPTGRRRYWSNLAAAGCFSISLGAALGYFFLSEVETTFFVPMGIAGIIGLLGMLLILNKPGDDQNLNNQIWKRSLVGLIMIDLLIAGWGLSPGIDLDFYQPNIDAQNQGRVWISPAIEYDLKFKEYFLFDSYESKTPLTTIYDYPLPNTGMIIGQQTVNNFDPMLPGRFENWMTFTEQLGADPDHPVFDLMAADVLVTEEGFLKNTIHSGIGTSGKLVIANLIGYAPEDEILDRIRSWEPGEETNLVLDDEYRGIYDCDNYGSGSIEEYEVSQSTLRAELDLDNDSWVMWSQAWYPGWNYYLDGNKIGAVVRGNFTFMVACVPEGEHVVEFLYQPLSIRIGAFISLASLSGVLGLGLLRNRSKRVDINF